MLSVLVGAGHQLPPVGSGLEWWAPFPPALLAGTRESVGQGHH